MKIKIFLITVVLAASVPALADSRPMGPIEEKNLLKGKNEFDAESGYIFLHGPSRQTGLFLKVPDKQDVAEYTRDWEEAFEKAQAKHVKRLSSWEKDVRLAKQLDKKLPEQPEEPTRENFSIGYIETRNSASFGPEFVFNKSKDEDGKYFSYLHQVPPGTYIYYGPIFFNPQAGYMGTCFCMGSVKFEVKSGTITNLGNFLLTAPKKEEHNAVGGRPMTIPVGWGAQTVNKDVNNAVIDYDLPESLKTYPNQQAKWRAAGKMNNYFGIQISRMAPVDGILGYKRDKVIDLKAAENINDASVPKEPVSPVQKEPISTDENLTLTDQ